MLPINDIMIIMQEEIFSGCEFLRNIGIAFLVMFIAVELIKVGIEATSGRGFHLDMTLYLYLFIAVFWAAYPELQYELKKYAYNACEYIYKNFGHVNISVKPSLSIFKHIWQGIKTGQILGIVAFIGGAHTIYLVALIIALLALVMVDIVVLSVYLGFEFTLATGMFFIPFFMSSHFNHVAKQWVNNMLMYCLQFPMIALVLRLVERLNSEIASKVFYEKFIGQGMVLDVFAVIFIPLLGLGLLWQALNVAKMMFPPSGGFIGTSIGTPIMGVVSYTMHTAANIATKAVTA